MDTYEIMAATSALAASQNPQVIAFARQMIHDHEGTSRALAQAAASAGLKPPPQIVGSAQAPLLANLQSQRGEAFDRNYIKQQVLAHYAALVVQQMYAASGDTPAIRQVAMAAVPVIRAARGGSRTHVRPRVSVERSQSRTTRPLQPADAPDYRHSRILPGKVLT